MISLNELAFVKIETTVTFSLSFTWTLPFSKPALISKCGEWSFRFDLCLSAHLQCRKCNKIKTNYMRQITVFIDLQVQLNMFRTNICPSSVV
jgi:hypothetical protein